MMGKVGVRLAVVAGSLLVTACGGGGGGDATASAVVGRAGGSLTSKDGRLTLVVPPSAVLEDTTFTITPIDAPAAAGQIGPAYDLGPEGVLFNVDVGVELAYVEAELGGQDESDLALLVRGDSGGAWQLSTPSAVDVDANLVRGARPHFSDESLGFRGERLTALGITEVREPTELFIASDGSDESTGTAVFPLASVSAALALMARGEVVVLPTGEGVSYASVRTIHVGPGDFDLPAGAAELRVRGGTGSPLELLGAGRDATYVQTKAQLSGNVTLRQLRTKALFSLGDGATVVEQARTGSLELGASTHVGGGSLTVRDTTVAPVGDELVGVLCSSTFRSGGSIYAYGGSVVLERVDVSHFGTGIGADHCQLDVLDSVVHDNTVGDGIGIGVDLDVRGAMTGTQVVGNTVGVDTIDSGFGLDGGGNVFSCNTEVDVRASSSGANASGAQWDHVPPAAKVAGEAFLNDFEGDVTTTGATLAPGACVGPLAPAARVILSAGDTLPGPGGIVSELPIGGSMGADGTVCFVVHTDHDTPADRADDVAHLACDVGGVVTTLLSDGQTFPGTTDNVTMSQSTLLSSPPITGNGVVLVTYGGGVGLVTVSGNGYRKISEAVPPLAMSDDGGVIAWVVNYILRADFGAGPVTLLDQGPNTLDDLDEGCFVYPGANVTPTGTIFAQATCTNVGSLVVKSEGGTVVSTALRQGLTPPDAVGPEVFDEIQGLRAGPGGHVYVLVRVLGGVGRYSLYRLEPNGSVIALPTTIGTSTFQYTAMPPIVVASDGSALVQVTIDGVYALVRFDAAGLGTVEFKGGDPVPGLPAATIDPYATVQLGYSPGGTFGWNVGFQADDTAVILGPLDGDVLPVAVTGQPLVAGGPPMRALLVAPDAMRAGGATSVADGGVVFIGGTASTFFDTIAVASVP